MNVWSEEFHDAIPVRADQEEDKTAYHQRETSDFEDSGWHYLQDLLSIGYRIRRSIEEMNVWSEEFHDAVPVRADQEEDKTAYHQRETSDFEDSGWHYLWDLLSIYLGTTVHIEEFREVPAVFFHRNLSFLTLQMEKCDVMCATCIGSAGKLLRDYTFKLVVIDESEVYLYPLAF